MYTTRRLTPVTHGLYRETVRGAVVRKLYSNGITRVLQGAILLASSAVEATLLPGLCRAVPSPGLSRLCNLIPESGDSVRESGSDLLGGRCHIFVPVSRFPVAKCTAWNSSCLLGGLDGHVGSDGVLVAAVSRGYVALYRSGLVVNIMACRNIIFLNSHCYTMNGNSFCPKYIIQQKLYF